MKKYNTEHLKLFILAACILLSFSTKAQKTVGIGALSGLNPNAVLHLVAPDKDQGLLVPTLTTAQRTASSFTSKLSSTDNGLLVFDTEESKFYYWKDNAWIAIIGTDVGAILSSGIGININDNNEIENTGDVDSTDDIIIGTAAGGDLSGTYPNPVVNNNAITRQKIANDAVDRDKIAANVAGSGLNQNADGSLEINTGSGLEINEDALQLTNTGVTSGTFGKMNMVPQLIVDETGRISGITELPITVSPTGAAGGELSGTYPNPTIGDDVIDSANIKTGTIITENLADGAVTSEKLASLSVDISKLNPGSNNEKSIVITNSSSSLVWLKPGNDQLIGTSSDGQIIAIDQSSFERNNLSEGQIFIGNASNEAQGQEISGDVSINVGGVVTIENDAITSAKIAENAVGTDEINDGAVNTSDLATGSVSTDKIKDANVTTIKLADESVSNQKLLAEAVTEEKIANDAITSLKIADGAISNADINVSAGIAGTKITPNFGAQNIATTGKATTASTLDSDGGSTLTTKDYVDDKLSGILPLPILEDGNGIADFSYDGSSTTSIAIDNGAGLDFDVDGKLQLADNSVTANKIIDDAVSLDKIANGGADQVLTTDASGNPQYENKSIFLSSTFSSGSIYIGDGSNPATAQTISGDATLANDGTLTLIDVGDGAATHGGGSDYIQTISVDDQGRVTGVTSGMPASDERLKKDIAPLENVLDEILKLNGYRYYWKTDTLNTKQEIGVIAQEVEQIFPELVRERSDGYKGVNYNGLVPVLLEAIKEQQKTIQQLAAENQAMKSDLEMIKAALGLDKKVSVD